MRCEATDSQIFENQHFILLRPLQKVMTNKEIRKIWKIITQNMIHLIFPRMTFS